MFSKHTFGARSYGHYQGYHEKGDAGSPVTKSWRKAQKAKRLRAEAFRAGRKAAKGQRRVGRHAVASAMDAPTIASGCSL